MAESNAPIFLSRDVDGVQIPSGDKMRLKKGSPISITQSLGGSFTLLYANAYMVRIEAKDADAIGRTVSVPASEIVTGPVDEETVFAQLRKVFDPEIPVNIVDLGLVYSCAISPSEDGRCKVEVKMTLTAPGCGMGGVIAGDAKEKILAVPGVADANVDLVWDPPWNQGMISEVGKMQLGLI